MNAWTGSQPQPGPADRAFGRLACSALARRPRPRWEVHPLRRWRRASPATWPPHADCQRGGLRLRVARGQPPPPRGRRHRRPRGRRRADRAVGAGHREINGTECRHDRTTRRADSTRGRGPSPRLRRQDQQGHRRRAVPQREDREPPPRRTSSPRFASRHEPPRPPLPYARASPDCSVPTTLGTADQPTRTTRRPGPAM